MKMNFIVWAMLLLCNIGHAQNNIKGTITDDANVALEGATIIIPEMNRKTVSDKNGNFELLNLPNGKIKILFDYLGYTSKIETFIMTGTPIRINETLHPSIIETEEIVVTGGYSSTQRENAVKIEVLKLNPENIKSTPNFTENLTKIPGVDMISKGNGVAKPVIRGLSMNDILILNNGIRYENYQYSSHHPLGIDEFGIEDVEIIKGPASLLYGSDAIGGVINFLKEKNATQNSIVGDYNLQLFSNSLGIINNFGIKGASGNFFGGLRIGQKSNADYLMGGGKFVPNSRSQEYSVKTNAGFNSKLGTFNFFYDFNKENLGLVEDEAIEQIKKRSRPCSIFYQQLNTHLLSSQNKLYLGNLKTDVNFAFQNTELIHFGAINVYEIQMKLATYSYETKIYLPSDKKSEYILGFQQIHQINKNINNRETKLLPDATINNYSGFCLLQHTFFEKLKFQTGFRYDYKTILSEIIGTKADLSSYRPAINNSYGSFSGSLGATYNLSELVLLRANLASAYRTPNLAELTSNGQHETRYELGDEKLVPEKSLESDLSMHYHKENFTFDLATFYNKLNHYIFISPTKDTSVTGLKVYKYMQQNAVLFGGEAGLHFHPLNIKWLHIISDFSYVIGKQKNGNYLPFVPAHKLNFEIKFDKENFLFFKQAYLSVSSHIAFNQNHAAPDESITAGYTLWDLNLGGKIGHGKHKAWITMGVSNIFDKKYIDHLSTLKEVNMYNPGRNIAISLKVPFGNE